jgi:hypothetical protein
MIWMLFHGCAGHWVQVIVAYQPCKATISQVGTVYQQHKCQQTQDSCPDLFPQQKFQNNLIQLLHQWRQNNDKLILIIDAIETHQMEHYTLHSQDQAF